MRATSDGFYICLLAPVRGAGFFVCLAEGREPQFDLDTRFAALIRRSLKNLGRFLEYWHS